MGTLKIGAAAARQYCLARDSETPYDLLLLGQSEICCLLIRVSFDYTALENGGKWGNRTHLLFVRSEMFLSIILISHKKSSMLVSIQLPDPYKESALPIELMEVKP